LNFIDILNELLASFGADFHVAHDEHSRALPDEEDDGGEDDEHVEEVEDHDAGLGIDDLQRHADVAGHDEHEVEDGRELVEVVVDVGALLVLHPAPAHHDPHVAVQADRVQQEGRDQHQEDLAEDDRVVPVPQLLFEAEEHEGPDALEVVFKSAVAVVAHVDDTAERSAATEEDGECYGEREQLLVRLRVAADAHVGVHEVDRVAEVVIADVDALQHGEQVVHVDLKQVEDEDLDARHKDRFCQVLLDVALVPEARVGLARDGVELVALLAALAREQEAGPELEHRLDGEERREHHHRDAHEEQERVRVVHVELAEQAVDGVQRVEAELEEERGDVQHDGHAVGPRDADEVEQRHRLLVGPEERDQNSSAAERGRRHGVVLDREHDDHEQEREGHDQDDHERRGRRAAGRALGAQARRVLAVAGDAVVAQRALVAESALGSTEVRGRALGTGAGDAALDERCRLVVDAPVAVLVADNRRAVAERLTGGARAALALAVDLELVFRATSAELRREDELGRIVGDNEVDGVVDAKDDRVLVRVGCGERSESSDASITHLDLTLRREGHVGSAVFIEADEGSIQNNSGSINWVVTSIDGKNFSCLRKH
jgi:hypothetical protein